MAQQHRLSASSSLGSRKLGNGIYLATVVSVMDSMFMGRLKVTLLKDQGNEVGMENQTYTLNYASPFFGYTPYEGLGMNGDDFNDTQKSYGMWMVPPDVGVTVLCMFVDGNPALGFWFACIPPTFANQMTPAIGGTTVTDLTADDKKRYNTTQPLPTGEINKLLNRRLQEIDPEKIKKPVHPIADRFLEQGTLEDDVRGVSPSTPRRQVPNTVFGISTPGPLDYRSGAKRMSIGPRESQSPEIPISRLGGTQFYIDDGDDRYQRKTSAATGPVQYADTTRGESGLPDVPYNEHTRIRTRTGHQILMHNSEDLIYIGNARGTAWVELSSNGKIDIYGADSISIHSENDLNIRADRDINMEAGRNINIKATATYGSENNLHQRDDDGNPIYTNEDEGGVVSGRIQIESRHDMKLLMGKNGFIECRGNEGFNEGDLDIKVAANARWQIGDTLDLKTGRNTYLTAGINTEIYSGAKHIETATDAIHMNGPEARQASNAQSIADLIIHDNLFTNPVVGWETSKYQSGKFKSIMKRVPMHEPWPLHENQAPSFFTPSATDRENGETSGTGE